MLVTATSEVVRVMGRWVRRADAGLALTAARNAAASVQDSRAQRLDALRTLRDLDGVLGDQGSASATGAAGRIR